MRVDQVVELSVRSEAPDVATRGCHPAAREEKPRAGPAVVARVEDVDLPETTLRRAAGECDVAAEIDERTRQLRPGLVHCGECSRSGIALPDAAEVDGSAGRDAGAAAVDLDGGSRAPPVRPRSEERR